MTSALGHISLTGILGGTAGKIDTDALIDALMEAKSVPQKHLQIKLRETQQISAAYQGLNSRLQALEKAAIAVNDAESWAVTSATSSNEAVVATSSASAALGSTTFSVTQLARAQVSTITAAPDGTVVSNPASGLDLTVGGTAHHIDLTATGSAADVAAAINQAEIGVRASVVNTDQGQVLQLSSTSTGAANAFTASGFDSAANTIVSARDAQITVGELASGGYTISSSTNTFTDALPGVTFSVGAVVDDVTITVGSDVDKIAATVQAMVEAANTAKSALSQATGKGGILQGYSDVRTIGSDLSSAISHGTIDGESLTKFGIDMDSKGVISFDNEAFTAAFTADAKGTMDAITKSVGAEFRDIAQAASAPVTGTLSQSISNLDNRSMDLNDQIDAWSDRLVKVEDQLRLKYIGMQSALARLQSQGDWLTNMFKSMQGTDD